jgi:anti-sigma regulatory factor (Ser/Thr protein kinase)
VVLYADPTPADDNRSYHVIAMLARRAGVDEQTQLLEEEVNNCVPLLVMPEGPFGFDVFAATEERGVFSQLDASQAEGVLTTEMQRYVDAVNIQNNPPPPAAT